MCAVKKNGSEYSTQETFWTFKLDIQHTNGKYKKMKIISNKPPPASENVMNCWISSSFFYCFVFFIFMALFNRTGTGWERERQDDRQQRATCHIWNLSCCGEDTAFVQGAQTLPTELLGTPNIFRFWTTTHSQATLGSRKKIIMGTFHFIFALQRKQSRKRSTDQATTKITVSCCPAWKRCLNSRASFLWVLQN